MTGIPRNGNWLRRWSSLVSAMLAAGAAVSGAASPAQQSQSPSMPDASSSPFHLIETTIGGIQNAILTSEQLVRI
jgi:hypothetical protein